MSEAKNTFQNNFGKFESLESTYYHVITCRNGFLLKGFSKGKNLPEKSDKIALLIDYSFRLVKSGYITEKGIQIDFYQQNFFNDKSDLILTLKPTSYEIHNINFSLNFPFTNYLDLLYSKYLKGIEINLKPAKKFSDFNDVEKLDFKIQKFTLNELNKKCQDLLNKGYHNSLVRAFWYKCKEIN